VRKTKSKDEVSKGNLYSEALHLPAGIIHFVIYVAELKVEAWIPRSIGLPTPFNRRGNNIHILIAAVLQIFRKRSSHPASARPNIQHPLIPLKSTDSHKVLEKLISNLFEIFQVKWRSRDRV
jgi:hypothetical protein